MPKGIIGQPGQAGPIGLEIQGPQGLKGILNYEFKLKHFKILILQIFI